MVIKEHRTKPMHIQSEVDDEEKDDEKENENEKEQV